MQAHYPKCRIIKALFFSSHTERLHHVDGTCVEWLEKRKHRSDNSSGFQGVSKTGNGKYRGVHWFFRGSGIILELMKNCRMP